MKKRIIKIVITSVICAILLILIGEKLQAQEKDKEIHFAFSTFVGVSSSAFMWDQTGNRWLAFGFGIASSTMVGILKECYDNTRPEKNFSKADLKADILGGITGSLTFQIILGRKAIHKKNIPIYDSWKMEEQLTKI